MFLVFLAVRKPTVRRADGRLIQPIRRIFRKFTRAPRANKGAASVRGGAFMAAGDGCAPVRGRVGGGRFFGAKIGGEKIFFAFFHFTVECSAKRNFFGGHKSRRESRHLGVLSWFPPINR